MSVYQINQKKNNFFFFFVRRFHGSFLANIVKKDFTLHSLFLLCNHCFYFAITDFTLQSLILKAPELDHPPRNPDVDGTFMGQNCLQSLVLGLERSDSDSPTPDALFKFQIWTALVNWQIFTICKWSKNIENDKIKNY